jgi:hypothetical protein
MRAHWMAAIVAVVSVVGAGAARAQDVDEDQRLLRLSAQAESATQHAQVAEQLIDRAETLDGQAVRLLRTSHRLEKTRFPNEHKLMASQQPGYKERAQAKKAEKTAKSHRRLAWHHQQKAVTLSVEP